MPEPRRRRRPEQQNPQGQEARPHQRGLWTSPPTAGAQMQHRNLHPPQAPNFLSPSSRPPQAHLLSLFLAPTPAPPDRGPGTQARCEAIAATTARPVSPQKALEPAARHSPLLFTDLRILLASCCTTTAAAAAASAAEAADPLKVASFGIAAISGAAATGRAPRGTGTWQSTLDWLL
eukprot:CAMPEP_0115098276 /NCGR_PEP_ID=MMETSP0227-20121206/31048_1 /TAXON_ID=89957 /ORGANISM="Polarella glacialis, Strain CCMP 1383" /LENGTH=176 /DNA_ID=CAMNT_0002492821 /DNA_START=586 /DNA_END=1116 /DNA_ORIENTATION=+